MIKVSCICPTYGRAPDYLHLLEEAVESFSRQDYPLQYRELIILNDCKDQVLTCSVPGVAVINTDKRAASLGEKMNLAISASSGDAILPWEDDDISLPKRISQAVSMLKDTSGKWLWDGSVWKWRTMSYWKPPQVWYMDSSGLHWQHSVGVRHNASAFSRESWLQAGKYPGESGSQGASLDRALEGRSLPAFPQGVPHEDWQYIYRWGVSPMHLTGNANTSEAWSKAAEKKHKTGTFDIKPKWRQDYGLLVSNVIAGK